MKVLFKKRIVKGQMIKNRSDSKNITEMYKKNLCTQCGTCYSFCPKKNIEIIRSNSKDFVFKVKNAELCNGCEICYEVCPGHTVNFDELNASVFAKISPNNLLGNFQGTYLTKSTDEKIRNACASGGTASTLLNFAIDSGMIDGALVVRMSKKDPFEPEVFIAKNQQEILSAAQSKYLPVPLNIGIREILDSEGKFAVVGLPCHIHGIRKAELLFPKVKEKIVLCIGLFCGPGPSFLMTDHLLRMERIKREDVVEIKYREGKWPGGMLIKLKTGEDKYVSYKKYLYAQTLFNRFRCGVCPDLANELADISLGDAHLPEFWRGETVTAPDGHELRGEDGWNIAISRTDFGDNILQRVKESGVIELIEISSERVVEAQKSMLYYKKHTISALNNILNLTKQELPLFTGIKKGDKLAYHDYIKSLIFILTQRIVAFKVNRLIIARIPRKILMYKLRFRQKQINKHIKGKIS